MSFYDDIPPIDLDPAHSAMAGNPLAGFVKYTTLLRWILYNPYELDYYVNKFIRPSSPTAIAHFLFHVAKLIGLVLLVVEFIALLISINRLPPYRIYTHLLVSAGLGFVVGSMLLTIVGFYSTEPAIAAIWAVQLGIGLPILHLLEMWIRDTVLSNQFLLLVLFNLFFGALFGILLNSLTNNLADKFIDESTQGFVCGLAGFLFCFGIFIIFAHDIHFGKALSLDQFMLCLCCAITALVVFVFRIDNFLYAIVRQPQEPKTAIAWYVPRVTPLLPPFLQHKLLEWLADSWPKGLNNAHQLWQYTNLSYQVTQQIVKRLSEADERCLVEHTTGLLAPHYRWRLHDFGDVGLSFPLIFEALYKQLQPLFQANPSSKRIAPKLSRNRTFESEMARLVGAPRPLLRQPRLDKPYQACLDGFLYLERGQLEKALTAFEHVGNSPATQEMEALVIALHTLLAGEKLLNQGPFVTLSPKPLVFKRKKSWMALEKLHHLVHLAWLYRHCRRYENRCILRLAFETQLANVWSFTLPRPEQALFWRIVQQWQAKSNQWLASTPARKLKPTRNAFVYVRAFQGEQPFQGRAREYKQLKAIWERENLQPVMLYGQPLIGKTSLFRFIQAKEAANSIFAVCRISPSQPAPSAAYQLLTELCAAIADATNSPRLSSRAVWRSSYYPPCKRYIRHIAGQLNGRKLIVVFDEFEQIETLFPVLNELQEWMNFLWELQKSLDNLSFLFITTAPPDQLRCHSVNPFIGAAHTMHIRYLDRPAMEQLLQHPIPQFIHQFAPDAIEEIWQLTAGQPYLVQLIGHTLVRNFNEQLTHGWPDPFFGKAEVDNAIASSNFEQKCERYFKRIMVVVGGADPGMRALLKELATRPHRAYFHILLKRLEQKASINDIMLTHFLTTLSQYDVIHQDLDERWLISVELFRRWLEKKI